jgi:hypothetical protein
MSALLITGGLVLGFVLLVLRSLAVDQVRGQLQRCIRHDVESTIASLPPELQEEWAEEWRAELESVLTMPVTAMRFARGLRATTTDLLGQPEPVSSKIARTRRKTARSGPITRLLPRIKDLTSQPMLRKVARLLLIVYGLLLVFAGLVRVSDRRICRLVLALHPEESNLDSAITSAQTGVSSLMARDSHSAAEIPGEPPAVAVRVQAALGDEVVDAARGARQVLGGLLHTEPRLPHSHPATGGRTAGV